MLFLVNTKNYSGRSKHKLIQNSGIHKTDIFGGEVIISRKTILSSYYLSENENDGMEKI